MGKRCAEEAPDDARHEIREAAGQVTREHIGERARDDGDQELDARADGITPSQSGAIAQTPRRKERERSIRRS
jgi:hypothetical protein